jgi:hypothetical protein
MNPIDPHHIHYMKRNVPPPDHVNNLQLPYEDKYLRLHINKRLTCHKHIFAKWKQLEITLTKMYWLLGHKSQLSTRNKPIWTWNTTLGNGFHFHQRNLRMLPIENFAHNTCRIWLSEGISNHHSAATALNTVLTSVHTQMTY